MAPKAEVINKVLRRFRSVDADAPVGQKQADVDAAALAAFTSLRDDNGIPANGPRMVVMLIRVAWRLEREARTRFRALPEDITDPFPTEDAAPIPPAERLDP